MFFSVVLVLETQHLFAKVHNKTNNLFFMVKCLVGGCSFRDRSFCLLELIISLDFLPFTFVFCYSLYTQIVYLACALFCQELVWYIFYVY